jgi:hypothetical protein
VEDRRHVRAVQDRLRGANRQGGAEARDRARCPGSAAHVGRTRGETELVRSLILQTQAVHPGGFYCLEKPSARLHNRAMVI